MELIELNPITHPLWRALIMQQPSLVFHTPMWLQVIAETYQFALRALVLVEDEKPVAGVAFGHVQDAFGDRLVTLPFSDFGDPIVDSAEQWQQLSQALVQFGHPIKLRTLHNTLPLDDPHFEQTARARWHGIDLTRGKDALWSNLHHSARRAIRKAEKRGATVRQSTTLDDMMTFYYFHVDVRKHKYGMVAQPRVFFEQIWQELIQAGHGFVLIAEVDDEPIAATLFLHWQNTLTYKFNASSRASLEFRPNDLIIWHGIQTGIELGLERFDFGLSDWDQDGLVRYKRKFATEEKTIHFLKHTPTAWQPTAAQPLRSLFPQLTDLFTDPSVPPEITAKAGDLLYRYFI